MNDKKLPIGFFDSGVGGISVLKQAIELLPLENYIYYGDSANVPYGNKNECEIKALSLACGDFLFSMGVKVIVMACNTATSISVQMMRDKYKIPVISIEPAVKPAMEQNKDGLVIVMATPATIQQQRYNSLLARFKNTDNIINVSCNHLAQLIESSDLQSPIIKNYIQNKFMPYKGQKISGIVLGCTHYSFISDLIQKIALESFVGDCSIFDGKLGTAKQLKKVLIEKDLINQSNNPTVEYYSSGSQADILLFKKFMSL